MVYVLFIVIALVSFAVQRTLQSKFERYYNKRVLNKEYQNKNSKIKKRLESGKHKKV